VVAVHVIVELDAQRATVVQPRHDQPTNDTSLL